MNLQDFYYNLPPELIAQFPLKNRIDSRLLVTDGKDIIDSQFKNIGAFLKKGDLLVLNDSKVYPVRLVACKKTGATVQITIVKITTETSCLALLKANNKLLVGTKLYLPKTDVFCDIVTKKEQLYELNWQLNKQYTSIFNLLIQIGQIALPPYIKRATYAKFDNKRYQNTFAKNIGSIAAPTAGFHFEKKLLRQLAQQGIEHCMITHHVGMGTFMPVRVENIKEHKIAAESYFISEDTLNKIMMVRKNKSGRIVAVGTTTVRCLEHSYLNNFANSGKSDLFIYPNFNFSVVDAIITNFHIPKSTLIMLVAAFIGTNNIKKIYQYAVHGKYRFYSYGDVMFLTKKKIIIN